MVGDRVTGTVTSGDWGHRVGLNLAYAFLDPDLAAPGTRLELDLIGDRIAAEVIAPCPYDPQNLRVRG
jgi:dimethylglycine dehydrogenase